MILRRPSSHITTPPVSSPPSTGRSLKSPSAVTTDCGTRDRDAMSADEHAAARPLSVVIPDSNAHAPYSPRRPNLREILANTALPPWTLAAFMAYLSNNHCLETLEFTMDAGRYKKHYAKMMTRASENGLPPAKDREYVQALWQRLVEAYIQPNGSREVNLPSAVRDPILNYKKSALPPAPETLDTAVTKIYELMEDSVLVPFLNSVYPQSAHPTGSSHGFGTSDGSGSISSRMPEDQSRFHRRHHFSSSALPHTITSAHPYSHSNPFNFRQSAPVSISTSSQPHRFTAKLTQSTSSPAASLTPSEAASEAPLTVSASGGSSAPCMTDDSGSTSTSSPINESPSTPPFGGPGSGEPGHQKRDSGMWKKLGRLSGMKNGTKPGKKKSHPGLHSTDS